MVMVVLLAAFYATASSPTLAQDARQREIERARRMEMEQRARDDARRMASMELRLLEPRKNPQRKQELNLAYAQIREDYRQLQIVNNDLARSLSSGSLDFKDAAKSASEIRKRAERLKENLALPGPEKPSVRSRSEEREGAEQVKSWLVALDRLVLEFVNNPVFAQPRSVDVRMSAKAGADLEQIIEVSDRIKKSSERLKKAARERQ